MMNPVASHSANAYTGYGSIKFSKCDQRQADGMRIIRYSKPFVIALVLNLATAAGAEDFFTAKIEPILKQRCY